MQQALLPASPSGLLVRYASATRPDGSLRIRPFGTASSVWIFWTRSRTPTAALPAISRNARRVTDIGSPPDSGGIVHVLMIVRRLTDRLQLITQPDHAHLAGTIMESCVALKAEPRRDAILRAVYAHDNGWLEEDQSPRRNPENGDVLDFVSAPLSVRHAVWPRALMRLGNDAWTAALIAQHA